MKTIVQTLVVGIMAALQFADGNDAKVHAQVVQLPSSRSLSYSGSVWVPDGGTVSLGGNRGASYGSTRSGWGPNSNRVTASSVGGSTLSASVRIIDLDALDEAILATDGSLSTGGLRPNSAIATTPVADDTASATRVSDASNAVVASDVIARVTTRHATYLAEETSPRIDADPGKWQRVLSGRGEPLRRDPRLLESDLRYYLKQGEKAENAGSLMAARVYYKMARELMTPELIERYELIVSQRKAAEEARINAEVEAVRRRF